MLQSMGLQELDVTEWMSDWTELILSKNFNLVHSFSCMGEFFNCLKNWQVYVKPLLKVKNDSSHLWVTVSHPLPLSAQILTFPIRKRACEVENKTFQLYTIFDCQEMTSNVWCSHTESSFFNLNYMEQEDSLLSFLHTIAFLLSAN